MRVSHTIQKGTPKPQTNICQLVWKYLIQRRTTLIANWRSRLYYSSSGSIFGRVCDDLKSWLDSDEGSEERLQRLRPVGGLFPLVGEALFQFLRQKSTFERCCTSKEGVWTIPAWRRALTFVFLVRFLMGQPGSKQWKDFKEEDYKLNVRLFRRYVRVDRRVMLGSTSLSALPDTDAYSQKVSKRKVSASGGDSTASGSPAPKRYKVSSSEDEDEDDEGDDDEGDDDEGDDDEGDDDEGDGDSGPVDV
jgi:hypothetical protein